MFFCYIHVCITLASVNYCSSSILQCSTVHVHGLHPCNDTWLNSGFYDLLLSRFNWYFDIYHYQIYIIHLIFIHCVHPSIITKDKPISARFLTISKLAFKLYKREKKKERLIAENMWSNDSTDYVDPLRQHAVKNDSLLRWRDG